MAAAQERANLDLTMNAIVRAELLARLSQQQIWPQIPFNLQLQAALNSHSASLAGLMGVQAQAGRHQHQHQAQSPNAASLLLPNMPGIHSHEIFGQVSAPFSSQLLASHLDPFASSPQLAAPAARGDDPLASSLREPPPVAAAAAAAATKNEPSKRKKPPPSAAAASTEHHQGRTLPMSLDSDKNSVTEYQCFLREQISFFEATLADVEASAQGRNKPIKMHQVGIQCRYCGNFPPAFRSRGASYFPAKRHGIYQAAQNMAVNHFHESCGHIPGGIRSKLLVLKEKKPIVAGGGKRYWASAAEVQGIGEDEDGLVFLPLVAAVAYSTST